MKKRIIIAGFGDTGLLTAIHLSKHFDVLGVSPKPCLVSGQELGLRLTRPQVWKRDYLMPYDRYRKLDRVRTLHGVVTSIDSGSNSVSITLSDGSMLTEHYDALVIASGVTNGFWRNSAFADLATVGTEIDAAAEQLLSAQSAAIIGGGATGVSVATNLKSQVPDKDVHFFFSGAQPLPGYHAKVRKRVVRHLETTGVQLHPGHRADIPVGFNTDRMTQGSIRWSTGQPEFAADIVLWAMGRVTPNSGFVPAHMLNQDGFVKADQFLRVPDCHNVFTVGDIAATDKNRSSARNWGYRLLGHNIRVSLQGKPERMKAYAPPANRWGSIYGVQRDGLRVFQPDGSSFRFPRWSVRSLLFPLAVRRIIYQGVRAER